PGRPAAVRPGGDRGRCVRQSGGAAGDRAWDAGRHRRPRLRRPAADQRRHAGPADTACLRAEPGLGGLPGSGQPGHPGRRGRVDIAKMLMAAGWADATPMAITWNGTTTDQHTVLTKLSSVAADLKAAGVSVLTEDGPAIAVVGEAAAHRGLSWFENKPLFGWRVLVPRTKEQAASVSERLRSYGAVPQVVPTIAVEPPRAPQQMERAIKGLVTGRFQWIAFTSANAVRAVREKLEEYGLDARAFAGIKVAAVGEQTAAALGDFGIKPDLVPEAEQ